MEECIYLRGITVDAPQGPYPFNSRAITQMGQLAMRSSITMLVGENGSGKSTFLEALALKLSLPSIGGADAERDETLHALFPLSKAMRVAFVHRPRQSFFLRAEDFFNYARRLAAIRAELAAELARADAENAHRSRFAQEQARAAYAGQLDEHDARYDGDLNEMSHGESFYRCFPSGCSRRGYTCSMSRRHRSRRCGSWPWCA